jgi:hypothetical protein
MAPRIASRLSFQKYFYLKHSFWAVRSLSLSVLRLASGPESGASASQTVLLPVERLRAPRVNRVNRENRRHN